MSIDILQERIRKYKNPTVVELSIRKDLIPAHILEETADLPEAADRFCRELLAALKDTVPAVRFSYGSFALMGAKGLTVLSELLKAAAEMGYYVLLDAPDVATPWNAESCAETIWGENTEYPCDGLVISPYIGSDAIKPFVPYCKKEEKDLYIIVRSPNKTAPELQDLLTGSRQVHVAAMDLVSRHGESIYCKCGYSRVCAAVSATSADSIRNLRMRYKYVFLLVDGLDYPSGNAKNCSFAFDRLGHGAAVCAGPSVIGAWNEAEGDGSEYLSQAVQAAERVKKNLSRYFAVL